MPDRRLNQTTSKPLRVDIQPLIEVMGILLSRNNIDNDVVNGDLHHYHYKACTKRRMNFASVMSNI